MRSRSFCRSSCLQTNPAGSATELAEGAGQRFKTHGFYDEASDTLTCYFSDEPSYGHRVDAQLTVYYSQQEGAKRIFGGLLKGVAKGVDGLDELGMLEPQSGVDQLKLIFLGLYCATDPSP